jgi:hypothetical protein
MNKVPFSFCSERLSIEMLVMTALSLLPENFALMTGIIFRMVSIKRYFFIAGDKSSASFTSRFSRIAL